MTEPAARLRALDVVRGLLMAVMALDHVGLMVGRFHSQEMWAGAWTRYQSALPFLTRFVTHLCAPGFFLLMGAGLALQAETRTRDGWPPRRITRSIVTRGLVLLLVATLLEVPAFLIATLTGPSLGDNPEFAIPGGPERRWVFTVLYALAVSTIVGGLLARARSWVWSALAVAAIGLTALTTPGAEQGATDFSFARSVLLISRWSHGVWTQYPFVPWFGIAAIGVLLGRALSADQAGTYRRLPWLGVAAIVAGVALRAAGGFGNLRVPRDSSWIEFLNVLKYPPSLVFTLWTVGGNLLLLSTAQRAAAWVTPAGRWLETLGRAPLAFYIAHLWLFAIVGALWFRQGAGYGVVYAIWLGGLVPLTFATAAFSRFVARRPAGSAWRYL
ncbi:MAG: heparan-alpha-glucosaminide N-acetyltransferase domain-containing protein [Vicinamibacterales bacterium]